MAAGPGSFELGSVVADRRIDAVAGRGGMGVVYRAWNLRLKRVEAVKAISEELARDGAFRQRFERETELAASIEDPHVVTIYASGEAADGQLFIAMRYVEGTTLERLIGERGRLEPSLAVDLIAQTASALDAAHAQGLVHRDVKPANVLIAGVEGSYHAYLTDFGIAKRANSESALTSTGLLIGTVDYMAPEQAQGGPVDARADVYALGATLFRALTGRVPFPGPTDVARLFAKLREPPPRASEAAPGIPPAFDAVLARALSPQPDGRYSSAGELASAAAGAVAAPRHKRVGGARLPAGKHATAIIARSAPPPALRPREGAPLLPTGFFGIRIDAAADLLEAREYQALPRAERLRKALDEQRGFLNGFLDPSLDLVLDLRTRVRPAEGPPIEIALIGRVQDARADRIQERASVLGARARAALPPHVTASAIDDSEELADWLRPLERSAGVDVAMVTRREVVAIPRRPDAKVAYYFSVVPFNWADNDWTSLYSVLSASAVPIVLSVALRPAELPSSYKLLLEHYATFYARLARGDRLQGGLYGERRLPPDAFALDAEPVFRDYARRLANRVYLMRIQLAAEGELPPGLANNIAATISPAGTEAKEHLQGERAGSIYEVRRARDDYERRLGQWNLESVDVCLFDGDPRIWSRPDPPPSELSSLCALGDARDASCAFRLPVAVDGSVPGFRVAPAASPASATGRLGSGDRT